MQTIKNAIPNTITSLNVLSGCISILFGFQGELELAIGFIILAAIFDFFDGFAARLLKAYSDMGKELDSLADMLSFGMAPSVIMFRLIQQSIGIEGTTYSMDNFFSSDFWIPAAAFLVAIFSALRLAKFNIDTRQSESFIGLPVPANAIFIGSLVFLKSSEVSILKDAVSSPYVLIALSILFSLLLVSEIPMFSLKIKNLKFADNRIRYIFIIISVILIITLYHISIPFLIILYITLSAINNWIYKF